MYSFFNTDLHSGLWPRRRQTQRTKVILDRLQLRLYVNVKQSKGEKEQMYSNSLDVQRLNICK